jgi:hypothetical protein
MKFCEVLDETITHFGLTTRAMSQASGVREASISEYRRGLREIHTDNLEKIIGALPPEAQEHFFMNCLIGKMGDMSASVMATMLQVIAAKMRQGVVLQSIDDRIPA